MRNPEILPDSRATVARGLKFSAAWGCMAVPIFCANCGKSGGYVPEEHCTFACYLCNDCVREHPLPVGVYVTPDEAFWARVAADLGADQEAAPSVPAGPAFLPAHAAPSTPQRS
jgi:hypothetical protein